MCEECDRRRDQAREYAELEATDPWWRREREVLEALARTTPPEPERLTAGLVSYLATHTFTPRCSAELEEVFRAQRRYDDWTAWMRSCGWWLS